MTATSPPSPMALQGIRVLDLSRVLAGPWCSQTLADLGADVIKVERPPQRASTSGPAPGAAASATPATLTGHPGGDDTRGWGPPYLRDAEGRDTSEAAYYLGANRNKRSVAIDIAHPDGQALIRQLATQADVLLENYKVGDLARYGLDAAALRALNPRLVFCSVTGFGQDGPYRDRAGYDYAVQGLGGLMSVTGERDALPGGGPQKVGVAVADLFTGMYATVAILAALRHRDATGEGQVIDMALLDTQVAMLANLGANYLCTGQAPGRMGNAHQNIVPYQTFQAEDGHLIVAVGNDRQFSKFCEILGEPGWAEDPRFATNAQRVRHRDTLVPLLAERIGTRPRQHWLSAMEAAKVPGGAINDLAEVFDDPQVQHRQMVVPMAHPLTDRLRLVASPMKLSATPVAYRLPPPLLGQHTQAILAELGHDDATIAAWRQQGVIA